MRESGSICSGVLRVGSGYNENVMGAGISNSIGVEGKIVVEMKQLTVGVTSYCTPLNLSL